MRALILQTNKMRQPVKWIDHERAIVLLATDRIIHTLGDTRFVFTGGINAKTGNVSRAEIGSILMVKGGKYDRRMDKTFTPKLTRRTIASRDQCQCGWCGKQLRYSDVTLDHIIPTSKGGLTKWENIVSCCARCNRIKGDQLPEKWGRELLFVPYRPNLFEWLYLVNSGRIVSDQFAFLNAGFRSEAKLRYGI